MKKKKLCIIVLLFIVLIILIGSGISIVTNLFLNTEFRRLNEVDKKMLVEYNQLFKALKKDDDLWADFNLADQTILAVSKDSLNTYMINPKNRPNNIFCKQINIPEGSFMHVNVYRVVPIAPQVLKIRLDIASNFNTINKKYPVFGNDVYYMKYNNEDSFEKKYQSEHFVPYLAHESFHYYMQNDWKLYSPPQSSLDDEGMALLEEQYILLDKIADNLKTEKNRAELINYSEQYVEIVSKRIANNEEYVLTELAHETAEGTAQYLSIKAANIVGYDYGVMYFDNVINVPFTDALRQIEAGKLKVDYLYNKMPYQTGAQLCLLFEELDIPNWQEKLNSQTADNPVYLYDILKDYTNS